MKKLALAFLLTIMSIGFANAQMMDKKMEKTGNPMVGGAAMYKTKDIVDNAVNSADHTTLVAAVVALPIFGAVGTITATGMAVGATVGAIAGAVDAANKEK